MNDVLRTRGRLLAGSMIGPACILVGHLLNVNSSEAPAQYVRDVSPGWASKYGAPAAAIRFMSPVLRTLRRTSPRRNQIPLLA